MQIQTVVPTQRTITVEIPEEYLNRTVEIMVIPVPEESLEQRKQEIRAFFAQHQANLSGWKFNREELYDR